MELDTPDANEDAGPGIRKRKHEAARATEKRQRERAATSFRKSLRALRSKCSDPEEIAKIVWKALEQKECEEVAKWASKTGPGNDKALAAVARVMQEEAASGSTQADKTKEMLAKAAKQALKRKSFAEKVLGFRSSKRHWVRKEARRGGRPNLRDDPNIKEQVREYLDANSTLTTHYRKAGSLKKRAKP